MTEGDKTIIEKGFKDVKFMDLSNTQLTSLENFPCLEKLKTLVLSDNQLTGSDLAYLKNLPKLTYLNLDNNNIHTPFAFMQLTDLDLKHISIVGNKVNDNYSHRDLFYVLPTLKTINDKN